MLQKTAIELKNTLNEGNIIFYRDKQILKICIEETEACFIFSNSYQTFKFPENHSEKIQECYLAGMFNEFIKVFSLVKGE